MGNKTPSSIIYVVTWATVRTRKYERSLAFEGGELTRGGWMLKLLQLLADRSKLHPESASDVISFRAGLTLLLPVPKAVELLNKVPEQVGRVDIRNIFLLFEERLINSGRLLSVKCRIGSYFRKYIIDFAPALGLAEDITRKSLQFRTRMYISSLPRSALSDVPLRAGTDEAAKMPLAAMPHSSIKDLYAKSLERVELDLQKVIQACISELSKWEGVRKTLHELSLQKFRVMDIALCDAVQASESKWAVNAFQRLPARVQLGLYCRSIDRNALANGRMAGRTFPKIRKLFVEELTLGKVEMRGVSHRQVMLLPHRMCSAELIAIFVLLLCYTGWNAHALTNMTIDAIVLAQGSVQLREKVFAIQGFKSKTDDETPSVVLDSTFPYAIYALELLMWNHSQLRQLGVINPHEKKLWFSYTSTSSGVQTQQYIGFQNALDALIKRHSLQHFSFDQIRAQVILAEQLRTNNIDHVRELAGHAHISVTSRYHNQELFRRLNSAVNLEFQRRLEATVQFRLIENGERMSEVTDARYIDASLLIPIGDGASCANPEAPPYQSYLDGDLCSAAHCHAGDGCPNRLIVIDKARIEELVRRRRYYLSNWSRLLDENRDAFRNLHCGRILFSLGLYDFVKASRYSGVLKQIEQRMEDE